ncbi:MULTISPECIES: DUF896 domain-containing protein [Shouchella]|uniref:UPF0291 protein PQ477_19665 n=2 Tax=Shouchella TaxID=2893057 RepID=A0ABY7W4Z4_9BACI|nr:MULTISPECIES: DUF896 domain-containing protein [Shouchella]MED4127200.1 DUF896 domain-containing protein [Shouchella miscanthi]WDF03681.1 DUF896 domain-containing protein [Shouchella hunanensis]
MLPKTKLNRINELSQLAKTTGLTKAQKEEQQALRKEYLSTFRSAFKNQLHSVKVVDEKGSDVTPQKLKDSKAQKQTRLH